MEETKQERKRTSEREDDGAGETGQVYRCAHRRLRSEENLPVGGGDAGSVRLI